MNFKEGDLVLVLREGSDNEVAGIVSRVEESGRTFINSGGVVELLHDQDQIRDVPENIAEPLRLRLEQNQEDLQKEIRRITDPLIPLLEEFNVGFWEYTFGRPIRKIFKRNKKN